MLDFTESLEVDRLQAALTRQFLVPALPVLEAMFLELRAETDQALSAAPDGGYDKPYPKGRCMEITGDVLGRLQGRLARPVSPGEKALSAFIKRGGRINSMWGILRERYFQNAIQLGALYVDVANDTVDIRKPKVEILPVADSGMALVRDAADFARIGECYWDTTFYANTALPALAPYFPMIMLHPKGYLLLASRNAFMVRLFARNGFRLAEQWLHEGPRLSEASVEALRAVCPPDLLGDLGPDAALAACQRARAGKRALNGASIANLFAAFDRIPPVKAPVEDVANARSATSVVIAAE